MIYYGKKIQNFTDKEKQLFEMDSLILFLMIIEMGGGSTMTIGIGGGSMNVMNTKELMITRTIHIGDMLGINRPDTQREFDELVEYIETTRYSFEKYIKDDSIARVASQGMMEHNKN